MTEYRPLNTSPLPVKLRIEDYLLLDEEGAFDEYRKTELIEGEVFYMNAQHRPHARVKSRLHGLFLNALRPPFEALVEGSVSIPPINVPEPDIVVTTEAEGDGLIPLESVRLIAEIADTTLDHDLSTKAGIYARAGVPEYWVVDVKARILIQMWNPASDGYMDRNQLPFGAAIEVKSIAGVVLETGGL
jgi:Uma2 family endonuclease